MQVAQADRWARYADSHKKNRMIVTMTVLSRCCCTITNLLCLKDMFTGHGNKPRGKTSTIIINGAPSQQSYSSTHGVEP